MTQVALTQPPEPYVAFSRQRGGSTLSRIGTAFRYVPDVYQFYRDKQRLGRDPFPVRALDGDFWATSDPQLIKQIYAAPADVFDAPTSVQMLEPIVGKNSLILLGGEEHKRDRKLLMPSFHGERMKAYGDVIVAAVHRRMARYAAGSTLPFVEVAQGISLDAILEAVFGVSGTDREALEQDIVKTVNSFTPTILFVTFLRRSFFGFGPWAKYRKNFEALDRRLHQIIESAEASVGHDILSLMLAAEYDDGTKMPKESIRDELLTMLMAGHETTALAMSWCVYHVLSNDEVRTKLIRELATVDITDHAAVAALPYLTAVCNESLRLHPVLADTARTLRKDWQLGHQPMKKGDQLSVIISLLHEDPELFQDPLVFKPERFIERNYKPYEFHPFGGGLRRCIGSAFAMYELKLSIAALFAEYDFALADQPPVVPKRRNITIGPSTDVLLNLNQTRRS